MPSFGGKITPTEEVEKADSLLIDLFWKSEPLRRWNVAETYTNLVKNEAILYLLHNKPSMS